MNLQTGLALLVSTATGFKEAGADISDFTYMGSPGVCNDSKQHTYNAYTLSGVATNQTNDARVSAEWCESAGPLLPNFVGFEFGTITIPGQPSQSFIACLYSGTLPDNPVPIFTPPSDGSVDSQFGVGSIAGVNSVAGPGFYCYRYNGFTLSPTSSPTEAPVTASPTDAPTVSSPPTKAPVTVSPTKAPVSSSPTKAPVTASPSAGPVTSSPSSAPVTSSPTKMPAVSSKSSKSSKISKSLSPNSKSTKNAKTV